jgi:hypothetical protein
MPRLLAVLESNSFSSDLGTSGSAPSGVLILDRNQHARVWNRAVWAKVAGEQESVLSHPASPKLGILSPNPRCYNRFR